MTAFTIQLERPADELILPALRQFARRIAALNRLRRYPARRRQRIRDALKWLDAYARHRAIGC